MITSLRMRNFKSFRDVHLTFAPLTVLVGPNSSGKSSALAALMIASRAARHETWLSERSLMRLGTEGPVEIVALAPLEGKANGTVIVDVMGVATRWYIGKEKRPTKTGRNDALPEPWSSAFGPALLLHLDNAFLTEPASLTNGLTEKDPAPHLTPVQTEPFKLGAHGQNLPAVLLDLVLRDRAAFDDIRAELNAIVPSILDIHHERAGGNVSLIFDTVAGRGLPAHAMSSGSLVVLAVLTAARMRGAPTILLIDELDRALHPSAAGRVVELLRKAMARRPELQIVATSHSPYLLDALTPDEVRVTSILAGGEAVIEPLTSHPRFDDFRHITHPGELWGIFGEDWVAGRRERQR
jgi:predicted ATPase